MLPQCLPQFAIGPLLGLAVNGTIAILCLVSMALYSKYRPLKSLFLFYCFLSACFFGWLIYALQRSEQTILWGYRFDYASLAALPACWVWFISALFAEKKGKLLWAVTSMSVVLAGLTLMGRGPFCFTLPLECDPVNPAVFRPQSHVLRPVIQGFCLGVCFLYLLTVGVRLWKVKDQPRTYILSIGLGLLSWFLGGLHDALRAAGWIVLSKGQILWLASLALSIFLTIAATLHFRSLEEAVLKELDRLNKVKSNALDHLSHELKPLCPSSKQMSFC